MCTEEETKWGGICSRFKLILVNINIPFMSRVCVVLGSKGKHVIKMWILSSNTVIIYKDPSIQGNNGVKDKE